MAGSTVKTAKNVMHFSNSEEITHIQASVRPMRKKQRWYFPFVHIIAQQKEGVYVIIIYGWWWSQCVILNPFAIVSYILQSKHPTNQHKAVYFYRHA